MRLALTFALVLTATPASAALIAVDLETPGDGLVTLDTESGLEWLDVTLTAGLSWAEIEATGGGYFAQGWRLAQRPEVEALWGRFTSAQQALSLLGSKVTYQHFPAGCNPPGEFYSCWPEEWKRREGVIGLFPVPGGRLWGVAFTSDGCSTDFAACTLWKAVLKMTPADTAPTLAYSSQNHASGGLLVRPIPEPSAYALALLGLSGLAVRGRRARACTRAGREG